MLHNDESIAVPCKPTFCPAAVLIQAGSMVAAGNNIMMLLGLSCCSLFVLPLLVMLVPVLLVVVL
jgi:hypothetical protein